MNRPVAFIFIRPERYTFDFIEQNDYLTQMCIRDRSLNGTDSIATMLPEIGYPYAVEFEINPDKEQNINGILFKGPHSTV